MKRDEEREKFFRKIGWEYHWVWSLDFQCKNNTGIAKHNRPIILEHIKKMILAKRKAIS